MGSICDMGFTRALGHDAASCEAQIICIPRSLQTLVVWPQAPKFQALLTLGSSLPAPTWFQVAGGPAVVGRACDGRAAGQPARRAAGWASIGRGSRPGGRPNCRTSPPSPLNCKPNRFTSSFNIYEFVILDGSWQFVI